MSFSPGFTYIPHACKHTDQGSLIDYIALAQGSPVRCAHRCMKAWGAGGGLTIRYTHIRIQDIYSFRPGTHIHVQETLQRRCSMLLTAPRPAHLEQVLENNQNKILIDPALVDLVHDNVRHTCSGTASVGTEHGIAERVAAYTTPVPDTA
eukprot:385908-Rhodomonas_salina.1